MHRAIGILVGGLSAAGIFTACVTSHELIAFEMPDSGTTPAPSFTSPAGDGGDAETATNPLALCIATTCPAPYDTCGAADRCATNLSNDSNNCGACGKVCPENFGYMNLTSACVDGRCEPSCRKKLLYPSGFENFADCNKVLEDGCEINISTDANNCGACGNKCADGVACIDGKCGCPPGFMLCADPYATNGKCIDVRSDDANCGACGNRCGTPADAGALPDNMVYACADSQCGQLKCKDTGYDKWADCDDDLTNGCEVYVGANDRLIDPNNCGKCGKKCAADQLCTDVNFDSVPECLCEKPSETRCGSKDFFNLGCFDLLSDPDNCGTCFNKCTAYQDNTAAVCRKGACELECLPGWGDCDGEPGNGCETNLKSSAGHCGACGNRCDTQAGQPCVEGQCAMTECDAGVVTQ